MSNDITAAQSHTEKQATPTATPTSDAQVYDDGTNTFFW